MNEKIQIGTSGWSFQDWKGPFYPAEIEKGDMLPYYAEHFKCSEINSTYYTIPHFKVFEHLVNKTPENFEFTVKFNKRTTHEDGHRIEAVYELNETIQPLKAAGKFSGYLAQFPYSFKNDEKSRGLLHKLRDTLPDDEIFVEFRHNSWLRNPVYRFLEKNNLSYVCVDEPQLSGLLPPQTVTTSHTGYIRLHGRNAETWWHPEKGDRYDYLYSNEELDDWIQRIDEMQNRVSKLYIFFNNCHHGQAPMNAKKMLSLFGDDSESE